MVELETEGLGKLRINVRDDLKRTWSRETRLEVANRCIEVFGAVAMPPAPPKNRHPTPRTRRFHRNWS